MLVHRRFVPVISHRGPCGRRRSMIVGTRGPVLLITCRSGMMMVLLYDYGFLGGENVFLKLFLGRTVLDGETQHALTRLNGR